MQIDFMSTASIEEGKVNMLRNFTDEISDSISL